MIAAAAVLGLTGCAENQLPELTEEEIRAVGEYVAITMMKYDINHRSRLMELTVIDPESVTPSETDDSEQSVGMRPVDDAPVVNAPEKEKEEAPAYTVEDVLALPEGISLTFQGQTVCESYPEESDFFSMGASDGKKLLVLDFLLKNEGGAEQTLDLLAQNARFTITINGEYSRNALATMLLDDLATFEGTLAAGDSAKAVLVVEVEDSMAGEIASVSLKVKKDEKACAIELLSP